MRDKRFGLLLKYLLISLAIVSIALVVHITMMDVPSMLTTAPAETSSAGATTDSASYDAYSYLLAEVLTLPYDATLEYGEPDAIIDYSDSFRAFIRFPRLGNPVDTVIANWVNGIYQNAMAEIDVLRTFDNTAEGEINVHYDSYLVNNKYVGIIEWGTFSTSHLAHPTDFVHTFNVDLTRGMLLENSDIINHMWNAIALTLLRNKILKEYPDALELLDDMDENWLNCLSFGKNGVIVVLERNKFLPGYMGTLRFTLPYDELGAALLLDVKSESVSDLTIAPTPIPTPHSQQKHAVDPSRPMIALTFDDGPSIYTSRILDVLEQYGGRATFCAIGNLLNAHKDTVARAASMGCEIIGHSWDHKDLTKLTEEEIRREILNTSNAIQAITGIETHMYRPPFGAVNDHLRSVSRESGFSLILWSVDPEDWKTRNADAVYRAIMKHAKDKAIVLSHDLYSTTAAAMERVIPELIAQGYQLVTVSELLSFSYSTLEPGTVYRKMK